MTHTKFLLLTILFFLTTSIVNSQRSIYNPIDYKDVKFSANDFGSMWTFDAVPTAKYEKKYGFKPDKKWLNNVQKSALQLGRGCSASFISEDGLIMTNHHCIRGRLKEIKKEGENLMRDGYYAKTLKDERRFPDLYVDQLISITDFTDVILSEIAKGKTDKDKIGLKNEKIDQIVSDNEKKTGLVCKMVSLYNGGKYSLYSYKRYNDIRLVMAPDVQIAATGWDWDNFTYPRYELDFAFLRAYNDKGNPVKVKHFFTWSKKGADAGEPIFIIGRPGNTDRMLSIKQLEYFRDISYPRILKMLNKRYYKAFNEYENAKENRAEALGNLLSVANGRKVYAGLLKSLNDKYIMTKKQDFENTLKAKVKTDKKLSKKYGNIWENINSVVNDLKKNPDNKINLKISLEVLNQKLGRLIFEVYGTELPPDATSTLRISDGVIKNYEYNGTIAPGKSTYYGLWDRYYSFGQKEYPWGLHERWKKPPKDLDLSIPMGFASTNDMVGGNSGSAVINKNAEVVGLIHDGNIESLAGSYIFLEEDNRAVATDSWGLIEALKLVYKTDRLVNEILNSKIK